MRKFALIAVVAFGFVWPTAAQANTVPVSVEVEQPRAGWQEWSGTFVYMGQVAADRIWQFRVCTAPTTSYNRFRVFYENDDTYSISSALMWDADGNEVWYKTYGISWYSDPWILSENPIDVDWASNTVISRITMSTVSALYKVKLVIVTGYCS